MKRKLSVLLAFVLVFMISMSAFASYDPTGSYYNNGYYGYNNYGPQYYQGDNYRDYNYSNGYYGNYYMSSWASDLEAAYDPTWYEQPQRQVVRGEAFLLYLRAVQRSLDRQGYSRLMAGYNGMPFSDYSTLNPSAQAEANVLYSNGILIGYTDNTMKFNKLLTRAEMAAIYSRFNRIFFNMGAGYNQWNYDGYTNYYNNNYSNYYNQYAYYTDINGHWAAQDIVTASANGVLRGMGNNYFDTEGPLTIEQIWKMLDCCVGYQGLKRSDIAYAMSQTFKVKFGKNIDENYSGTNNGTRITRLSASTTSTTISEGESKTIRVSIYPTNAGYQKLNWTSSNTRYVSIEESWNQSNGNAYVTIYGRSATSNYITLTGRALDGSGKTVTIKVKVNRDYYYDNDYDDEYITSLTLSESEIYLEPGESVQVNAKIKPSNADYKNVGWSSNNTNIATTSNVYVSGSYSYATITARNVGETYVYAKALDGSGESDYVKVIVGYGSSGNNIVNSATANPSSVNLGVGNSEYVSVTLYPTNATDKNVNWVSDNTNVARVTNTSNSGIQIVGVGVGTTNIRGIAVATGKTICTIPVVVTGGYVDPNPGNSDTTPPRVTLEGATSVDIHDTITITAKVTDDTGIASFNIGVNDIIGMTGSLSPSRIEKISNTEYRITLMGVEVASQCICIAGGVAVDTAGNRSNESNEIVIFINSGE